jgi:hypothetical protein
MNRCLGFLRSNESDEDEQRGKEDSKQHGLLIIAYFSNNSKIA